MSKEKFCQEGEHYVPSLFWAKSKTRKSACLSCSRKYGKPLQSNPKVKVIDSDKPLNEAKPRGVSSHKSVDDKSIPELLKLAQIVVNKSVRTRDSFDKLFTCISCDELKPTRELQAGHYYPVSTSSYLRFNPNNIHSQCEYCNCFLHGNTEKYKVNLINKIGLEAFKELERDAKKEKKWDREELLEIIKKYKL